MAAATAQLCRSSSRVWKTPVHAASSQVYDEVTTRNPSDGCHMGLSAKGSRGRARFTHWAVPQPVSPPGVTPPPRQTLRHAPPVAQ